MKKCFFFLVFIVATVLTALTEYVEDVTNPKSVNFIKEEDRIVTFGMDVRLRSSSQGTAPGYHVISMRDDFKTIYGDGVKKVPFTFSD